MRQNEITIGREYALKWDLSQRGQLPMSVVRVRLLGRVEVEVTRYSDASYRSRKEKVNGYQVEVLEEPLHDPRWSHRGRAKPEYGTRNVSSQEIKVGAKLNLENARDLVSPWDEYSAQRHAIDTEASDREAAKWEAENRSAQVAERLAALGFTVRQHGDPWKRDTEGYAPEADYTIQDKRITLEALSRLLDLAEGAGQ